jgi:hypothetical protein
MNTEYVMEKLAQSFDPRKVNPNPINIDRIPSAPVVPGKGALVGPKKGGGASGIEGTVKIPSILDKATDWFKDTYNGAKRKFAENTNPEVQSSEYVQTRNTGLSTKLNASGYTMGEADKFQDSVYTAGKGKYDTIHGVNASNNAYNDNPADMVAAKMSHNLRDSKNEFGFNPMKVKYLSQVGNGSDVGYGDLNNSKYFNFAREMGKNTDIYQAAKSAGADWYNKTGFEAGKASGIMSTVGGLPVKNLLGLQPFKK